MHIYQVGKSLFFFLFCFFFPSREMVGKRLSCLAKKKREKQKQCRNLFMMEMKTYFTLKKVKKRYYSQTIHTIIMTFMNKSLNPYLFTIVFLYKISKKHYPRFKCQKQLKYTHVGVSPCYGSTVICTQKSN